MQWRSSSLVVAYSPYLERERGWPVGGGGVTCVLSVPITLMLVESFLFGSWLISGEQAGEFRILAKCVWLQRYVHRNSASVLPQNLAAELLCV